MTQFWKIAALAALPALQLTCAHEPPVGTPGVGCMVASCCHGWVWMMGCLPAQPPFCGCSCKESPRPYGSKEQCLAEHPEASQAAGAGIGQTK